MDKKTSRIIELLRFPLIVGVVLIHAYSTEVSLKNITLGGASGTLNLFVQNLFSQVFARVAVPAFFIISGFLLFHGKDLEWDLVITKWKQRLHTLLIPFLFWNLITLAIQYIGQLTPGLKGFFSGTRWNIDQISWITIADAIIGFQNGPINFPFWFIRDLMILVVLSPFIISAIKYTKGALIVILLFLWVGDPLQLNIIISREALLFFSFGLLLSRNQFRINPDRQITVIGSLTYIVLSITEAYLQTISGSLFLLHEINIILGCVLAFALASMVKEGSKGESILLTLSASSFFVYAAHGSLLQVFKKLLYVAVEPVADWAFLSIYFMATFLTIVLLLGVYFWILPRFPLPLRTIVLGTRLKIPGALGGDPTRRRAGATKRGPGVYS